MKKISNKEFAWYLVCGLIAALGIILMVFGIIGTHMDATSDKNFIKVFEKNVLKGFELRYLGIIFFSVGALVAVCVLVWNAKRADRDVEKKLRREQRLAAQQSQNISVKDAVEVVVEQK